MTEPCHALTWFPVAVAPLTWFPPMKVAPLTWLPKAALLPWFPRRRH